MSDERRFPLLLDRIERARGLPESVPWSLVMDHERQAIANHDQGLKRLAQRGGLSPFELWCVVHDRRWRDRPTYEAVVAWLREIAEIDKTGTASVSVLPSDAKPAK